MSTVLKPPAPPKSAPAKSQNPGRPKRSKGASAQVLQPTALTRIGLIAVILVPLPPVILDLLLVINITLSIIILATTIYVKSPLEFAVLPSLLLAVTLGQTNMIPILTAAGANPNLANSAGETPLIRAVQRRDVGMIRVLLAENADPDQADIIAGMSARAYAKQDGRNPIVSKLLEDAPKKVRKAVSGPKF